MLLSICTMCNSERTRFIKDQEASRLLSILGIKTHLSKIPLVGIFCFRVINKLIQDIK